MALSKDDLVMLLRNYCRLEQEGSRMFRRWGERAEDPGDRAKLFEFADIEQGQASAIARLMKDLAGAEMNDTAIPMEDAIVRYIDQIEMLATLGEKLRFNHTVMTTLERPIVVRALVESTDPETRAMFEGVLDNEEAILGWCDRRARELGVETIDFEKYYAGVMASF